MDDATLSAQLTRLGLSEKEVDTYLTVPERGELTASEIGAETAVNPCQSDDDRQSIAGAVTGTRQGLVEPTTNDVPIENALVVDTDDGEFSVGGPGALLEDFEASGVVTLLDA